MSAVLQARAFYGLRTDVAGNAHFTTDSEVLYPVGSAISIHDFAQKRQRLIRLPEKYVINNIILAPNKKFVAVSETGEKPSILVYDLVTLKRKKSLGIPYEAIGVTKFNAMAFTLDSKTIIAITGEPDQTMLAYNWEKGKVESILKVGNPQNAQSIVNLISTNPSDITIAAIGGHYSFRFLTASDNVWRNYGFSKADNVVVLSMTWLNIDRLLAGLNDGRILYLENGDLKNIFDAATTTNLNFAEVEEDYSRVVPSARDKKAEIDSEGKALSREVNCLTSFAKGFAFAYGSGKIYVFEKDGANKYWRRNIFVVPTQITKEKGIANLYNVNTVNVNPSMDRLVITTGWARLFYAHLWGPEMAKGGTPEPLAIMGQDLHHGPVNSMSMCSWKPIVMTSGAIDRSVRIWDYNAESLLMAKQYLEDIFSVALHPTGLFCLIGFTDKLRFMSIQLEDLLAIHEFPIRYCSICSFSNGGHLFAAINGFVIQVYESVSFRSKYFLKGHTGQIRDIQWTQNDVRLMSVGSEGAIYQWEMVNGMRAAEVIAKKVMPNTVAVSSDSSTVYAGMNNGEIYEIKENEIIHQYKIESSVDSNILYVILGRVDNVMLISNPHGVIQSVKFPFQETVHHAEYHVHATNITKMSLSYNETTLVSSAEDGTMCFWKLVDPEGIIMRIDKDWQYSNEILVNRDNFEDKLKIINSLEIRMAELETEFVYKSRQLELQNNDKIQAIHQGYIAAIDELRVKINELEEGRVNELNTIHKEIEKMQAKHETDIEELESSYNVKLINEYKKYSDLEGIHEEMISKWKSEIEELNEKSRKEIEEMEAKFKARLHEKEVQLEEIREEMAEQIKLHELMKEQIEDDADREIIDIKTSYETQLRELRQINLKIKGETGLLRNKYSMSRKETEDLKRKTTELTNERHQFQKVIQMLEKDLQDLKKEIDNRDETVQEKERRIAELMRTNQELEKFKFVLNYKIQQLNNAIEPRDEEIREFKEKRREMEVELINLEKTNRLLELKLNELKEKLFSNNKELRKSNLRDKFFQEQLLNKICTDISNAAAMIQDQKALKTAVIRLHHKYSASSDFLKKKQEDIDANREFEEQRCRLERTIRSLQSQRFAETRQTIFEGRAKTEDKCTKENVLLMGNLNELRESLTFAKKRITELESLVKASTRQLKPPEIRKKLEKIQKYQDELEREYKLQLESYEKIIIVLKDDVQHLHGKVQDCQGFYEEEQEE